MAAQSGAGALPDTAAVPLADGRADNCPEEVSQASGAAGIYGMILCKTEKFPGSFTVFGTAASRLYTAGYIRLKDGSEG